MACSVIAIASGQIAYIYKGIYNDDALCGSDCEIVRKTIHDEGDPYYIFLMGRDDSVGYSADTEDDYPLFFD